MERLADLRSSDVSPGSGQTSQYKRRLPGLIELEPISLLISALAGQHLRILFGFARRPTRALPK
jgi:hypothetical protein